MLLTTDLGLAQTAPFVVEAQNYFYIYQDEVSGTEPLYLCQKKPSNKTFVTSDAECEGLGNVFAQLGYWSTAPQNCKSKILFRLYKEDTDDHFYTTSSEEVTTLVGAGFQIQPVNLGSVWLTP